MNVTLQRIIELGNAHRALHGIETQGKDGDLERVLPKTFVMDGKAKLTVILNSAALQVKVDAFNKVTKDRRAQIFKDHEAAQKSADEKKRSGAVIAKEEQDWIDDLKAEAVKAWQQEFTSMLETEHEVDLDVIYLNELHVPDNDYDPFAVGALLNAGVITQADRKAEGKKAGKARA